MTRTEWTVLQEAHDSIRAAVAGVPANGWHLPTPCEQWDVTQVLQHAIGDQFAYVSKITGGPGPSYDPFSPSGSLDGASPAELLEAALSASADAFGRISADSSEVPVPLPPFQLSAELAVGAAALDLAVHAWDIAVATDGPSTLKPSLAQALLPVANALVEPLRGFAFSPAITPAPAADEAASLLNHLGRRADWKAGSPS
ncbi:TIGR03086 family metal-binding protein [Streptomyces sp. NPDC058221]|uniref:TIGR03086 family metal-binding protein n=1 Tax=Streptomyces sp. NPDC058221 TaxID=3346388 RepID=UPI0036E44CA3